MGLDWVHCAGTSEGLLSLMSRSVIWIYCGLVNKSTWNMAPGSKQQYLYGCGSVEKKMLMFSSQLVDVPQGIRVTDMTWSLLSAFVRARRCRTAGEKEMEKMVGHCVTWTDLWGNQPARGRGGRRLRTGCQKGCLCQLGLRFGSCPGGTVFEINV